MLCKMLRVIHSGNYACWLFKVFFFSLSRVFMSCSIVFAGDSMLSIHVGQSVSYVLELLLDIDDLRLKLLI